MEDGRTAEVERGEGLVHLQGITQGSGTLVTDAVACEGEDEKTEMELESGLEVGAQPRSREVRELFTFRASPRAAAPLSPMPFTVERRE